MKPSIALLSMPIRAINWPNYQLGLLKSVIAKNSYRVKDFYLNLDFAGFCGFETYRQLSDVSRINLGDWLFSEAAFGIKKADGYLPLLVRNMRQRGFSKDVIEKLPDKVFLLRKAVKKWIGEAARRYDWGSFDIVGFSCCFDQTVPSIAMAKFIKEKYPGIFTVFGGGAMEGMVGEELSKRLDFIDCIVQGEGEQAILDILKDYDLGRKIQRIYRAKELVDLNKLPMPDYDEYYRTLKKNPVLRKKHQKSMEVLPYETSRGCWWGEKKKCLFCGFCGKMIKFRRKNTGKILNELDALSKRYDQKAFQIIDNILDHDYFNDLVPMLAEKNSNYNFFFEVRTTIELKRLLMLKNAGFVLLQAGIESLSTNVLRLMNKGVNATQNIEFLKNSRFLGLNVAWIFLFGIPGENKEDYEGMTDLIPKISHLAPPLNLTKVRLDTFSPLYERYCRASEAGRHLKGFKNEGVPEQMVFCYPEDFDHKKVSDYISAEIDNDIPPDVYKRFKDSVSMWRALWKQSFLPELYMKKDGVSARIIDTRYASKKVSEISGDYLKIADELDKKSSTMDGIVQKTSLDRATVEKICGYFVRQKLVVKPDSKYVWLPIKG